MCKGPVTRSSQDVNISSSGNSNINNNNNNNKKKESKSSSSSQMVVPNQKWGKYQKNPEHQKYPIDKRLNLFFDAIPGFSCNPLGLLEIPVTIVLSYIYWDLFNWSLMKYMFPLYLWKELVPMSVCLHRYFSHKGFKTNRMMQFVLYWMGCLASQGPPLWWASKHRRHHASCDTEDDPHSPYAYSKLYAWIGWVYLNGAEGPMGRGIDEEYIQDHLKFPELAYMENFYYIPTLVNHMIAYHIGGLPYVIFISCWSAMACQLATLYFNVAFHDVHEGNESEYQKQGSCKALNLPFDPLSNLFGEAYHEWHHIHPRAHHRPGIDAPYWLFIKPMLMLGIFEGENCLHQVAANSYNNTGSSNKSD